MYGLLVGLGARARGVERRVLAPEIARAVAAQFGALLLTLHGVADGWAEAVADPRGALAAGPAASQAPASLHKAPHAGGLLRRLLGR